MGTGQMTQHLRVLAALAGDPNLVPSTEMAALDFNSRVSVTLFWPPKAPRMYVVHIYTWKQVLRRLKTN